MKTIVHFFLLLFVVGTVAGDCGCGGIPFVKLPETCSTDNCKSCDVSASCDRYCSVVNGVKTCSCDCYYPCDSDSECIRGDGGIRTKAPVCHSGIGCRYYYRTDADISSNAPLLDEYYPIDLKLQCRGGYCTQRSIYFYKKCSTSAQCAIVLTNCHKLGANCKPYCSTYDIGQFCVCKCPGTLA